MITEGPLAKSFRKNVFNQVTPEGLKAFRDDIFAEIVALAEKSGKEVAPAYAHIADALISYVYKETNEIAPFSIDKDTKLGAAYYNIPTGIVHFNEAHLSPQKHLEPIAKFLLPVNSEYSLNLLSLISVYGSAHHEYQHVRSIQFRQKNNMEIETIGQIYTYFPAFVELHPKKAEFYLEFSDNIYVSDREELCAERVNSQKMAMFEQELKEYIKTTYPNLEKLDEIAKTFPPGHEQDLYKMLSREERNALKVKDSLGYLSGFWDYYVNYSAQDAEKHRKLLQKRLPEMRKDFKAYAKMFVAKNGQTKLSEAHLYAINSLKYFQMEEVTDIFIKYHQANPTLENNEKDLHDWQLQKKKIQEKASEKSQQK